MILLFQSSFRLSEKNEKDKKRKELTPVSATPTHMLRICVNPSFKHLLSPRGDRCEQSAPTVRQLLNHGYRFETLKRRLGFTAVPCQAMANLAGIDRFAQANAVGVAETGCSDLGACLGANIAR